MATTVGVVVFPGTNCEHDAMAAVESLGGNATLVFHADTSLEGLDALILPGGFAHGDYLRPGAIARFSPIMESVVSFAAAGGPVVGICNGFQVLTKLGLLPGFEPFSRATTQLVTLTHNDSGVFRDDWGVESVSGDDQCVERAVAVALGAGGFDGCLWRHGDDFAAWIFNGSAAVSH